MKKNKLVYGVGINDADYAVYRSEIINGKKKIVWRCPFYRRWQHILGRCYAGRELIRYPTYIGCSICKEWIYFSNFKKWMEQQEWEGYQLDKDFLVEGNKIYSPDTCVFMPNKLNGFITTCGAKRGQYPLGVFYMKNSRNVTKEHRKPYTSQVSKKTGGKIYLGMYATPEEAHQVYLKAKLGQCMDYIEEFKESPLIVKGLTRIKDKIQHHLDNNLELTEF